jgi:ubiquitin carboxyl-terminal hydrolase 9/24
MPTINYELIGIVIHSGQANAGHYYSFIKDTRCRYSNNTNQWYRFNDTSVDEIQLTEQMLEEECFGGTFRVQKDNNNNSNEERTRFWNAYMLIYQCIEPSKLLLPPLTIPSSPKITRNNHLKHRNQHDSLSQLADLVVQSEHNDLFHIKKPLIPSNVLACVKDENLEFLKNRDTYCDDYFQFLYKLSSICLDELNQNSLSYEYCTNLILNFLFNTHFRTHRRLRKDNLQQWVQLLSYLFEKYSFSCEIFWKFLYEKKENGLKLYLLDCPIDDIRQIFKQICESFLQSNSISIDLFIEQLILLLDKSVVEQVKHCQAYFQLIYTYININEKSIEYLFKLNTFQRLIYFLFGENIDNRRWNSNQAKEFGIIHEIISILTLYSYSRNEYNEIKNFFSGQWLNRYLKEICYVFQEISLTQLVHTLQLIEILTKNNENFSENSIRIILQSIIQAHINDLKSLFKLLSHILVRVFFLKKFLKIFFIYFS